MQQATVNLLADMGAQPSTLQGGPGRGDRLDRHGPRPARDHLAAWRRPTSRAASRSRSAAPPRRGGRVRRRPGRRRRGLGRRRHNLAPGAGTRELDLLLDPRRHRQRHDQDARRRRQRQPRDARRRASPSTSSRARLPLLDLERLLHRPAEEDDPNAVELGVKFRSDEAGFITGLRFYKTSGNTGTHVGHLWAAGGAQLAEATFSGETASGWQQVSFGSPVAIDANTTYVASYHAPNGHYAAINGYFASRRLRQPAAARARRRRRRAERRLQLRRRRGRSSRTDTFESSNYWVDVVFEHTVGPDTTPPTITARAPGQRRHRRLDTAPTSPRPSASRWTPATINGTNVRAARPRRTRSSPPPSATTPPRRRATLDPTSRPPELDHLHGDREGRRGRRHDDASPATPLAADSTWSFTTAAPPPPPPDEGPGGPILVISNAANPFSRYYAEILRAEGLNEFTATDISNVTAPRARRARRRDPRRGRR